MGRSVRREFIADERVRRQTLRKRKVGLLKKLSEIKTLCCVDACAVIYTKPGGGGGEGDPDAWPSPSEARLQLQRFSDLPVLKQAANMMNQEKFLGHNILRLGKNLEREKKKSRWVEVEKMMMKGLVENDLQGFGSLEDLKDVDYLLEEKIKLVADRIQSMKKGGSEEKHYF
ncbi:hypothetical protein U1Q18_036923 [Sarracenia purpurea var. burkii]